VSAHFTFTTSKKKAKKQLRGYAIISGAGLIGFDQKMDGYRILSDREAFVTDRNALKSDVTKVWNEMVKREFDAA
jgi:hypothetical protein